MAKRARRPPRLDDRPAIALAPRVPQPPDPRRLLVKHRVTGRHARFGRAEALAVLARVRAGDPAVRLGLAPPDPSERRGRDDDVHRAVLAHWGWDERAPDPIVAFDPALLFAAIDVARERVRAVAGAGGRIAVATSRPASLLPLHQALARWARSLGADVLTDDESDRIRTRHGDRWLRWLDGVAVLTDRESLCGDAGVEGGDELLFRLPRPALVIGDRGFAGTAAAAGIEVVALADLDAAMLGVAAARGDRVTVVPIQEDRPPVAYEPLVSLLTAPGRTGSDEPAPMRTF